MGRTPNAMLEAVRKDVFRTVFCLLSTFWDQHSKSTRSRFSFEVFCEYGSIVAELPEAVRAPETAEASGLQGAFAVPHGTPGGTGTPPLVPGGVSSTVNAVYCFECG